MNPSSISLISDDQPSCENVRQLPWLVEHLHDLVDAAVAWASLHDRGRLAGGGFAHGRG
jgi:hypothetical protein